MKPTETTPVAKPVGTFSACLQLISQSCSAESPAFYFPFTFSSFVFFLKRHCDRTGNKSEEHAWPVILIKMGRFKERGGASGAFF